MTTHRLGLSLVASLAACQVAAGEEPHPAPSRPVHTYSIVAVDRAAGEIGVAVQSHWFSVGSVVPWAEPGAGAVATQSFTNPSFGPRGLQGMREGRPPAQVIADLVADDPAASQRQVAMVDLEGRAAAHTGSECIAWAGHRTGDGYSVQANMMLNGDVVPAMAAAFENSTGPLAHRLLLALEAAQRAGGDVRGRQSAALLVVRAESTGNRWEDRLVDLRVDDHATPVVELRRLYFLHSAYTRMDAGDAALAAEDTELALKYYTEASSMDPENIEMVFWHAFTLATNDRLPDSLPLFRRVFAADANWVELLSRLPAAGLTDEATVSDILDATGRPQAEPPAASRRTDGRETRE